MWRVRETKLRTTRRRKPGRALEIAAGRLGATPIGGTRGMRREEAVKSVHEERGIYARTPVELTQQTMGASSAGRRGIKVSAQQRGGSGARGF